MDESFDTGRYLREGWDLFKANSSSLIVATIIYFVVIFAANLIPVINFFTGFLLPGAMFGGIYYVILDLKEGKEFNANRMFDGFRLNFVNLTLVNVITSIFILIAFLIPLFIGAVFVGLTTGPMTGLENYEHLAGIVYKLIIFTVPAILLAIFISAWYLFAYLFVVDKGLNFWEAMEASRKIGFENQFQVFFFLILLALINVVGVLAFGVGILVSFPFSMCVTAMAYKSLSATVPSAARRTVNAPPPPLPASSEAVAVARPAKGYVHCFVFIEGPPPSESDMLNIIKAGAPEALEQADRPIITGHGVDFWPVTNDELKNLITEAMKGYRESNHDAPKYTDSSMFKIKVWKGRDNSTNTNMALASVVAKSA